VASNSVSQPPPADPFDMRAWLDSPEPSFDDRQPDLPQLSLLLARQADPGAFAPRDVVALQPVPIRTLVTRLRIAGQTVTSIYRRWEPGASALCRLCPAGRCSASYDACMLSVSEDVPPGEAYRYSSHRNQHQD
jgi:hypothetical protein